jgi:hypothetical protein
MKKEEHESDKMTEQHEDIMMGKKQQEHKIWQVVPEFAD